MNDISDFQLPSLNASQVQGIKSRDVIEGKKTSRYWLLKFILKSNFINKLL